jgi:hypothetical protein
MNKELLDWVEDVYKNYEKNSSGRIYLCSVCSLCGETSNHDTDYPNEKDTNCIHCGKEDKWEHKYLPSLSKEEFINSIKTDSEFAAKWGVSVNRRELTLAERKKIYSDIHIPGFMVEENVWLESKLRAHNIPKHVITLTHNNKTIEVYE